VLLTSGRDNFGSSNQQLALVKIGNEPAKVKLYIPAKFLGIKGVNAAVHESKTICRTYQCVGLNFEY